METKLTQYSVLASGLLAMTQPAPAQVVYTDLDPDILLFESMWDPNETEYLDLNFDGIIDVGLYYTAFYNCGYCPYQFSFNVDLFNGAEIATVIAPPLSLFSTYQSTWSSSIGNCQIPSQKIARGFQLGDIVNFTNDFDVISNVFETFACGSNGDWGVQIDIDFWDNPWSPADKPFLAFKIPTALGYNFAWLRLYSGENDKVYITDLAYQSTTNAGIVIDLPVTEISASQHNSPTVYFADDQLYVHRAKGYQIQIINMQGAVLMTQTITTEFFTTNLDFPAGIYMVVGTLGAEHFSKEIAFIR